jgi:hypothetical protein
MKDFNVSEAKWQRAWSIYLSTNKQAREGVRSYVITPQLYNQCMDDIGSSLRIRASVPAARFCQDFWEALKRGCEEQ